MVLSTVHYWPLYFLMRFSCVFLAIRLCSFIFYSVLIRVLGSSVVVVVIVFFLSSAIEFTLAIFFRVNFIALTVRDVIYYCTQDAPLKSTRRFDHAELDFLLRQSKRKKHPQNLVHCDLSKFIWNHLLNIFTMWIAQMWIQYSNLFAEKICSTYSNHTNY